MDQIKIGRFIAERRKEKDLTQAQLAESLNYSDKSVSKWERGDGVPDVLVMQKMALVYLEEKHNVKWL